MGEEHEVDVEQIMARIRESIRRRRGLEESPKANDDASPFEDSQAAVDFAYLHSGHDIRRVSFVSHRPMLGPLVVAVKKALMQLLTPILDRQASYNAASTRVTTHIKEWIGTLHHEQVQADAALTIRMETIERSQAPLRDSHALLQERVVALESQLRQELVATESRLREMLAAHSAHAQALQQELQQELQQVRQHGSSARTRIFRAERALRRILYGLETSEHGRRPPDTQAGADQPVLAEPTLEFDHAELTERFRGTEEEIKERQRTYVQSFEGRNNVLDIGCGRGEFLELLREHGVKARGVDLDLDMVLLCRDKGFDVVMDDAFAYLGTLPDDSLGGVFAAQVIEHLPPRRVIELVKLCHRKLGADGVLILETPNPKCLMVFAESFYKDPSHIQPAHPDTMQFLLETMGFHAVELRFLAPVDPSLRIPSLKAPGADLEPFNESIERLNSLLFGFQDYAVIGRKAPARA